MRGPRLSNLCCFWTDMPPTTHSTRMFVPWATALMWFCTWTASSLVGRMATADSLLSFTAGASPPAAPPPPLSSDVRMWCRIGKPNANVLPLPVSAAPMRSFRCRIAGCRQRRCTSVGVLKRRRAMFSMSFGCKSKEAQSSRSELSSGSFCATSCFGCSFCCSFGLVFCLLPASPWACRSASTSFFSFSFSSLISPFVFFVFFVCFCFGPVLLPNTAPLA
mmetsp:Transcript_2188/g.5568  ORF Transcript_2188/g.5568 Transcript_2188/m.5568 type:complete len:220 (+) Transcript_2188:1408-2067(+)